MILHLVQGIDFVFYELYESDKFYWNIQLNFNKLNNYEDKYKIHSNNFTWAVMEQLFGALLCNFLV